MLKPSECFAGPISDATGLSLILPRAEYERLVLIVVNDGTKHAICLGGVDREYFMAFACDASDNWAGLHIPGIVIELDEASLFDMDGHYAPLASMVRSADKLSVRVNHDGKVTGRGGTALPIMAGLPPCAERSAACFLKWQIVLGEGEAKRVLHCVDLTKPASAS